MFVCVFFVFFFAYSRNFLISLLEEFLNGKLGNFKKSLRAYEFLYSHAPEIVLVPFQTTAGKQIPQNSKSNEFFGFSVRINIMFTLYYSLLSVQ